MALTRMPYVPGGFDTPIFGVDGAPPVFRAALPEAAV
jgi:hypothetical protein